MANPNPLTKVVFYTDSTITDKGFNVTYSTSPCGGILVGSSNTVDFPRVGTSYPRNADCVWQIKYDEGTQVEVKTTN